MRTRVSLTAVIFLSVALLFGTEGIRKTASPRLYPIRVGNSYGYIDSQRLTRIEPHFDYAWGFREGIAKVEIEGKLGFIGPDGKFLITPRNFGRVEDFSEGMAVFVSLHNLNTRTNFQKVWPLSNLISRAVGSSIGAASMSLSQGSKIPTVTVSRRD